MNLQKPLAENVRIAQKAVVLHPTENKFLLLFRKESSRSRPGDLDLPGGNLAPTETHEDSLQREILEETGLQVKDITPVYMRSSPNKDNGIYFIYIGFVATALSEDVVIPPEEEIAGFEWVTLEDFQNKIEPNNNLHNEILSQVEKAFRFR